VAYDEERVGRGERGESKERKEIRKAKLENGEEKDPTHDPQSHP